MSETKTETAHMRGQLAEDVETSRLAVEEFPPFEEEQPGFLAD